MNKTEKNNLIEHLIENMSKTVRQNSDDIIKAYDTLHEDGGVPLTMKATMRGNMEEIKTTYSLSFPKDKVKISYKTTFNVKQGELFLDGEKDSTAEDQETHSGEDPETRPLASDAPDSAAPAGELPVPSHNMKAGKDIAIKVGEFEDGPVWKWFAELNFPAGGQDYDGAYDSQETFKTRDAAGQAGLIFALKQLDDAVAKEVFDKSAKSKINKARGLIVAEIATDPAVTK